ncbi:AT-hook motif nuclear-localized protein 17 [Spatholobus suberectus]|nr:AT-hook motif nuclear-localized protein 17 [Spatholobus suberectus]
MANNGKSSQLLPPPSSPALTPPPPPSPPPSPTLSISAELDVLHHKPNEQMQPQPTMVALAKRPRGRPPGSKNNPKPALDFLKPIVLNIPVGIDIVDAIINFARKRDVDIVVHNASGPISKVTLSNLFNHSHDLFLQGNLHMLSLSGFYTKSLSPSPPSNVPYSSFAIQVSRIGDPKLFGGLVGGKVISCRTCAGHGFYHQQA